MSKGLATPTVPQQNDVVLGEFKIYGNYEKPSEIELGATRGGCKVDLERSIKEIKFDGAYGAVKGLRRYEKFMVKITANMLCLKYANIKIISDCESNGLWESKAWTVASGGTYAAETTIVAEGDQSAKGTLTNSGDGIHEVFAATKDLTAFDNSVVSDTADYIGFSIYISTQDLTDLGSADLRITFHQDAEDTETNGWYYDVATSALTADTWTAFKVLKSAFTEMGTGNWATITGVSMKLDAAPAAEVVCYIDHITLIEAQTLSTMLPVNGGGCSYTDEGDYRKFLPNLEITDSEFYENVAVVSQKHDGKQFIIIANNVLNDGKISLALQEKDEIVNETVWTSHYKSAAPTTIPLSIRDYDV